MKKSFILLALATLLNAYCGDIWYEAEYGTVQSLQKEFERCKAPIDRSHFNWTPLKAAARGNNINTMAYLIKKGANVNHQERDGDRKTPLMFAAEHGRFEACKFLVEHGARILLKDSGGRTALDYCRDQNIRNFLRQRSDMHAAAFRNDVVMLKIAIMQNGFSVNQKNKFDLTPLMIAVAKNSVECVKHLLSIRGIDVNAQDNNGMTPLMQAAISNNLSVCIELLNANAKINMQNKNGITALMFAAHSGHLQVCKLLVDKGADIEIKDKDGNTAPQYAKNEDIRNLLKMFDIWDAAEIGTAQTLQKAFEKSKHPVDAVRNNWTALMFAVQGNNIDTMTYLISKGANVNFKNEKSITPLLIAILQNKLEACNLLLAKGAEIDKPDKDGWTALHYAVSNKKNAQNSHHIVEALLAKGADPNFEDTKGFIALHYAVVFYNEKNIDSLIKAGTDIGYYGASVMSTAIREASPEAITYLMKKHNFKLPADINSRLNVIYERMKKDDVSKWTEFCIQNNIALDWNQVMLAAITKNDIAQVKKLLPKVNFNNHDEKNRINFLSCYLQQTNKVDFEVVKLFTDAGCHIFHPSKQTGPAVPLFGMMAEYKNDSPIGIAISKQDFKLADVLLQAKKYCLDSEIDSFRYYIQSAAKKSKDIKSKNKILKISRMLNHIDPAKLDKPEFVLDANALYAKARSIDPDCKDPVQDALETAFDMEKAFAVAMAQTSAQLGGGNSIADNRYIQALILYDCATALGHREALKNACAIRGKQQLFYSDIQYARNSAINMLAKANMQDKISHLAKIAPLPEIDTKKAEILKKVFITNYSSSKSVYDAFKYALPEDFKVFAWKNAKGNTIYEISGKTSNRYPFNGQMCSVNKFKPVEVIFVDRKNGIPEMAAFKLSVDVPLMGSQQIYYTNMGNRPDTVKEDQFFRFIYY